MEPSGVRQSNSSTCRFRLFTEGAVGGTTSTVGLTPRQITSTVISAHAVLALVASLLAVPLGVGLYLALAWITSGTTDEAVVAPWRSLALIPIGAVLVVVAATSVPARLATWIRPADALRYE